MRVLIVGRYVAKISNGLCIYKEASRQKFNVKWIGIEEGINRIIKELKEKKYDWVFVTGITAFSIEEYSSLAKITRLVIWDDDPLTKDRRFAWEKLQNIYTIAFATNMKIAKENNKHNIKWFPDVFDANTISNYDKKVEKKYDIAFGGRSFGSKKRQQWLRLLKEKKYKMLVVGLNPGWKLQEVNEKEMVDLCKQAKIIIDIKRENFEYGELMFSDRTFKTLGSNQFYLIYDVENINKLFIPGKHLVTYNNTFQDLVKKIDYWLEHEQEREKIALAGQKEVFKHHLLEKRICQYWEELEKNM